MPIALTLYTLRDLLRNPEDIAATLSKVREIGYRYVQVSGVTGAAGSELRALVDAADLQCIATHCRWDALRDEPQKVIDELQALGARHTALAWLDREHRSIEGYGRVGQVLEDRAAEFLGQGLTLSYHNHAFEFERYTDGRTGLQHLLAAAPSLHMEFDVYWVVHAGGDPIVHLREFQGQMPLVHLKDREVVDDQPVMAEVGRGLLNWPGILATCRERGVEWYIVEQDECRRPPLESIQLSFEFLKSQGVSES